MLNIIHLTRVLRSLTVSVGNRLRTSLYYNLHISHRTTPLVKCPRGTPSVRAHLAQGITLINISNDEIAKLFYKEYDGPHTNVLSLDFYEICNYVFRIMNWYANLQLFKFL